MSHKSRRSHAAALFVAAASAWSGGGAAAAGAPPVRDFETRFRFVESGASPYPAAGCIDHRALMFIVRETESDAAAAKLLAARDCRPLVAGADYVRCGPGGWAYPARADRISYAAYCRLGAQDLRLYVLDSLMQPAEDGDGDGKGRPR